MQWTEIIGHAAVIARLQTMAARQQVPHAMLFIGPEGIGKRLTARCFAAALLCQGDGERPCGRCPACRQLTQQSHPDYYEVLPAGSSIKIEQVRQLQQELAHSSYAGGYRVCVLDAADTMTKEAANSLLKTLEEPVGQTVFILLAPSRHALLDTIVSRCQVVPFQGLSEAELSAALADEGHSAAAVQTAARLSGGRLGRALELLAPEGLSGRDRMAESLSRLSDGGNRASLVLSLAAAWDKADRPNVVRELQFLATLLRDILQCRLGLAASDLWNTDCSSLLFKLSQTWDEAQLTAALAAVDKARRAIEGNANSRLTAEALWIELGQIVRRDSSANRSRNTF